MDAKVRELLFDPLKGGSLRAIIPDFRLTAKGKEISTPAELRRHDDEFEFTAHFSQSAPPAELGMGIGYMNSDDCFPVVGQVAGEVAFKCEVFPPSNITTRSRGTSVAKFHTHRLDIVPEGTDRMTRKELNFHLRREDGPEGAKGDSFYAHLIYDGPKLVMRDSGSETVSRNDFLGEATLSVADTHQFSSKTWQGALIRKGSELHLYVRADPDQETALTEDNVITLVDSINQAVGFALGCQPWPAYREIRLNHQVVERWLSPRFAISTSHVVPISDRMWSRQLSDLANSVRTLIPCFAEGVQRLNPQSRQRLATLLWHFRSGNISALPPSTQLLIVCASVDGLMKLVAGVETPKAKAKTDLTWRKANDVLGFCWDKWTSDVFALWGKHRHMLAHGWLSDDAGSSIKDFFPDHAQLGCAFNTVAAAYCGYEGPILADPFEDRVLTISDIKTRK
jgi:hypothetical protein